MILFSMNTASTFLDISWIVQVLRMVLPWRLLTRRCVITSLQSCRLIPAFWHPDLHRSFGSAGWTHEERRWASFVLEFDRFCALPSRCSIFWSNCTICHLPIAVTYLPRHPGFAGLRGGYWTRRVYWRGLRGTQDFDWAMRKSKLKWYCNWSPYMMIRVSYIQV